MSTGKLVETLRAQGNDMENAMERFLGDEALYRYCLSLYLADEHFERLGEHLDARDYDQAFTDIHTLKGVTANLGLTLYGKSINALVEALRGQDYADLARQYNAVKQGREQLLELMRRIPEDQNDSTPGKP